MSDCRKLQFTIDGPIDVIVLVEEGDFDGDGFTDLKFTLTVDESLGTTADLRGLFWDVGDESKLPDMAVIGDESPDVTDSDFAADSVKDLGNGANLKGAITKKGNGFDAGVEIGQQGIGHGDDIQTTSFAVSGGSQDLTLDDIGGMRFGVRLTSYGEIDGDREGSLKIADYAPHAPDAQDDDFVQEEDTVLTGNLFADNGSGPDTDDDGDPLTVIEVDGEAADVGAQIKIDGGWVTVNPDGSFEFIPETGYFGEAAFEYTVSDGDGGEDCADVTITVDEVIGETKSLSDGLKLDPLSGASSAFGDAAGR